MKFYRRQSILQVEKAYPCLAEDSQADIHHQDTPRSVRISCLSPSKCIWRRKPPPQTSWSRVHVRRTSTPPGCSNCLVALFIDVEHEVALVTSGNCIRHSISTFIPIVQDLSLKWHLTTFSSRHFNNVYPYLSFGPEYVYPSGDGVWISCSNLKDVDAMLILGDLRVDHLLYDGKGSFCLLSNEDRYIDLDLDRKTTLGRVADDSFVVPGPSLRRKQDPMALEDWYETVKRCEYVDLDWVTQLNREHLNRLSFIIYGNKPALDYVYSNFIAAKINHLAWMEEIGIFRSGDQSFSMLSWIWFIMAGFKSK